VNRSRLRLPLVVVAAAAVAEGAVLLLRPRGGLVEPVPVSARSYFSEDEITRARRFRRPQLALYAASAAIESAVLVALLRRPPRWMPRRPAAAGAVVSLVLTVAPLPVQAIMRRRAMAVGLSTQSWRGWALDLVKSAAIGAGFAAAGAGVASALERRFGRRWWGPGAVGVAGAGAAVLYAGPVLLDPIFNRFTPLPEGPARADVLALARDAGVTVGEVYEVDASRRTNAANAYVTGLGRTKRVVLYDTLMEHFDRDETRLVVAHELGHVRHRDVLRGLAQLALVAPLGVFAVARLAEAWAGEDRRHWVPALALAGAVVSTPLTIVTNQLSRRVEARTDAYALGLAGAPEPFISFQRRIALRNVADPDPPRWLRALLGTHPSTVERIGIAEAYRAGSSERPRSKQPQA
jgi:STE24 endopeptidase